MEIRGGSQITIRADYREDLFLSGFFYFVPNKAGAKKFVRRATAGNRI